MDQVCLNYSWVVAGAAPPSINRKERLTEVVELWSRREMLGKRAVREVERCRQQLAFQNWRETEQCHVQGKSKDVADRSDVCSAWDCQGNLCTHLGFGCLCLAQRSCSMPVWYQSWGNLYLAMWRAAGAERIWWLSFKGNCWSRVTGRLSEEFRGTQEKQMVVEVLQMWSRIWLETCLCSGLCVSV